MQEASKCCPVCRKTFQTLFECVEHSNEHTGETPFLCSNCGDSFLSIRHYLEHRKTHPNHHYYPCKNCQTNFSTKINLEIHKPTCSGFHDNDDMPLMTLIKNNSRKMKQCQGCKDFFPLKEYAIHEKYFVCSRKIVCEVCGKSSTTKEKLDKHLCCVKVNKDVVKCSCLEEFALQDFKNHIGNNFQCCACSMTFKLMANLIKHIRTHTNEKPYICNYCGRGFTQHANLRNHITIHLGISPLKCPMCDFSCKTEGGMRKHVKKHEAGLFDGLKENDLRKKSPGICKCITCGKEFRFKRNLAMHVKKHDRMRDKSESPGLCSKCGKMFGNSKSLKQHCKSCLQNPCMCATCGKLVANAHALKSHAKTHNTTKEHQCDICQKRFSVKSYLNRHIKIHNKCYN